MENEENDNELERSAGLIILTVLVIVFLCGLFSSAACTYQKDIQVERHLLTVTRIDSAYRINELKALITWEDENFIRYYEFTNWPSYYHEGQKIFMLMRK